MALPLRQETTSTVAEIIHELERAEGRPDATLRRAVPHAGALAPIVIGLVEKAVNGVWLLPEQNNLLFWSFYVLAAGQRTELCQPLLRLLQAQDDDYLHDIFGYSIAETIKRVAISVFDGDADALITCAADQSVDSFARWALLDALARLTFDGAISRDMTLSFLDRFEREGLAEPGDPVWQGWQDAVIFLGFEQLHERMRLAWADGRIEDGLADRDHWERQIAIVRAMAPGDPGAFDNEKIAAVIDPVEALPWPYSREQTEEQSEPSAESPFGPDPAAGTALDSSEQYWLAGFLDSKHAPITAMSLEGVDGYFCALTICPSLPTLDEYMPALWNHDIETEAAPDYDSPSQAEYVEKLLARHLKAISQRLEFGVPHTPFLRTEDEEEEGRHWAAGFLRGMTPRIKEWEPHLRADKQSMMLVNAIITLGADREASGEVAFTPELRAAFLEGLPHLLLDVHHRWRGLSSPLEPAQQSRPFGRKVGRNEPCPCGSGKKFKRCCGASQAPAIH